MKIVQAGSQCFDALSQKYPEIANDEALQEKVMAKAEAQCPKPLPQAQIGQ